MRQKDPLANPAPLIRRVYSYVAYRIGDGAEAEDVTSEVFERALRYRGSYDATRGAPLQWLLGIARRCIDDSLRQRPTSAAHTSEEEASGEDLEAEAIQRLALASALGALDERGRDLVALHYGAGLGAREIGELLGLKTNAVEVALHRARARVRAELDAEPPTPRPARPESAGA
jgi:RNA polymerase sigma factor (sigma-70 family)